NPGHYRPDGERGEALVETQVHNKTCKRGESLISVNLGRTIPWCQAKRTHPWTTARRRLSLRGYQMYIVLRNLLRDQTVAVGAKVEMPELGEESDSLRSRSVIKREALAQR